MDRRLRSARERSYATRVTAALGGRPDGTIAVIVGGDALDTHLVSDSALTWQKGPGRKSI